MDLIMFKWLAKKLLPTVAANIDLDIDTVQKSNGVYLRVRVEAFGFTLVDRLIKVSGEQKIDNPVDVFEPAGAMNLPDDFTEKLNAQALKTFKK